MIHSKQVSRLLSLLALITFPLAAQSSDELFDWFETDTSLAIHDGAILLSSANFILDSLLVEAIFIRPAEGGPFPGVMCIPGYMRTARHYIGFGVHLANEGYAVLTISQRGFGRSAGKSDFVGPLTLKGLKAGYARFKTFEGVDSTRTALFGYSRGAMAASLLATKLSGLDAAILCAGVYDFERGYEDATIPGLKRNIEVQAGITEESFRLRSSVNMMERLKCPVLILHGALDKNVNVNQAYLLRDRLTELGKPFEIQIFPDKEHSIGRENMRNFTFDFLERHLKHD